MYAYMHTYMYVQREKEKEKERTREAHTSSISTPANSWLSRPDPSQCMWRHSERVADIHGIESSHVVRTGEVCSGTGALIDVALITS